MPVDLIPTMTSNTTPSGVASASKEYTPAWRAFDKSNAVHPTNAWLANDGAPEDLRYAFPVGQAPVVKSYRITGANTNPADGSPTAFTLNGSNNGTDWTTLDTQAGLSWVQNETKTFTITNYTAYRYYMLWITAVVAGGWVLVGEWQLVGLDAAPKQFVSQPRKLTVAYPSNPVAKQSILETGNNADTVQWEPGWGNFYTNSLLFGHGGYSNNQYCSIMRFTNVPIAQGMEVSSAILRLVASVNENAPYPCLIYLHDSDNAPQPTTQGIADGMLAQKTSLSVQWTPGSMVIDGSYYVTDLKDILQSIVNRPGWVLGNAIAVICYGTVGCPAYTDNLVHPYPHSYVGKRPLITIDYYGESRVAQPRSLEVMHPGSASQMASQPRKLEVAFKF